MNFGRRTSSGRTRIYYSVVQSSDLSTTSTVSEPVSFPPTFPPFISKSTHRPLAHAYTVLSAHTYRNKRFLKIRNPWGKSEWTGRWSDGSKEWTPDWLGALEALEHKFGDDGVFVMEYDDFLSYWTEIERTQLFDRSWVMSAHWLDVPCRPLPGAWQYGDVSCKSRFF